MRRTSLACVWSMLFFGIIASTVASPEAASPKATEAKASSQDGGDGQGKKEESNGNDDSKSKPLPLPPVACVIEKVTGLCATNVPNQFLVRIGPAPVWLIINSDLTPDATDLVRDAAKENWPVAVWYDATCTVTSLCVRLDPYTPND